MDLSKFPRATLGHWPTPLEPMDRLRKHLGARCPRLLIKRDDCSGLATGGNKTRKLEFLMGRAQAEGAKAVVTFGAVQSNHARQTAAAAAKLGLECDLILLDMVRGREAAYENSGNILLDKLLGARVRVVPANASQHALQAVMTEHESAGRKVYVVPTGGSNATGALGYVAAYHELGDQCARMGLAVTTIVHASSSGGTQAGLVAAAAITRTTTRILGINVYKPKADEVAGPVREIARELVAKLDGDTAQVDGRVEVIDGFLGEGYGIPSDAMREAVRLAARTEGLLLDPVYSGKAFAALIELVRVNYFRPEETIVFLHTGGAAALPAYASELL